MDEVAALRKTLSKVRFEELQLCCEGHSVEKFESQPVECRTCITAQSETEKPAPSMNDPEEVPDTGSEDQASRTILVENVSVSTGSGAKGALIQRWLRKHGFVGG